MTPVLAPLLDLPEVGPALAAARDSVDRALRLRAVARGGDRLASEVGLRAAVASAGLEGHGYGSDEVRAGTVTDPVVQGALRVEAAIRGLAPRWPLAPRQALARLHVLAARDCPGAPDDTLGRPLDSAEVRARLGALCELVAAPAGGVPTLLRAAVVHGELLALRPFTGPSGIVARAAARLTLIAGGLDPTGLVAPDLGHAAREPEYVGSANAFSTGTPDGVRAWLKHYAAAVGAAADELVSLASS